MPVTGLDDAVAPAPRVVLVDARPDRRALMCAVIDVAMGPGTVVAQVSTSLEALVAIDDLGANAVVLEIQLPVEEGLAAITALRAGHPSLVIVVCTFRGEAALKRQAAEAGSDTYLVKPVSISDLRRSLGWDQTTFQAHSATGGLFSPRHT